MRPTEDALLRAIGDGATKAEIALRLALSIGETQRALSRLQARDVIEARDGIWRKK